MAKRKTRKHEEEEEEEEESKNEAAEEYEQHRAQRIKENKDRMKSLGLLDLSKKLKPETPRPKASDKPSSHKKPPSTDEPPRRSSRLKSLTPVNYSERRDGSSKREKVPKNVEICIPEGEKPEVYTKEHEKLLGHSKTSWTLFEDGYDEDGQRIYDPDLGKTCHQCRQKTLGLHTECSKCKSNQGQFCGDCLYMRYGENVIEVNKNRRWICPVCRDICNCSRCRRRKGWAPTGAIYRKVTILGYKSVAHYLIMTYMQREKEEPADENHPSSSIKNSEPSDDLADATEVSDESDDDKSEVPEKHEQLDDEEPEPGSHESEDEDEEDANGSADDSE